MSKIILSGRDICGGCKALLYNHILNLDYTLRCNTHSKDKAWLPEFNKNKYIKYDNGTFFVEMATILQSLKELVTTLNV